MSRFIAAISILALVSLFASAGTAAAQLAQDPGVSRFVVAPQGNEARYRVREQLAGIDFPNDAVGTTKLIEGALVVQEEGTIAAESKFTINLASLTSDQDRRDNFLRRRTLQTDSFPSAVFVPTAFRNLKFPLPQTGPLTFQLIGDLTIRGVTRPVTWDVVGKIANGAITGDAKTRFTFADFRLEKPRVRSVLSVEDDIGLEYTFFLVAR